MNDLVNCKFEEICSLNNTEYCERCCYNLEAITIDNFHWNGEGEEPTQEELDEEMH